MDAEPKVGTLHEVALEGDGMGKGGVKGPSGWAHRDGLWARYLDGGKGGGWGVFARFRIHGSRETLGRSMLHGWMDGWMEERRVDRFTGYVVEPR